MAMKTRVGMGSPAVIGEVGEQCQGTFTMSIKWLFGDAEDYEQEPVEFRFNTRSEAIAFLRGAVVGFASTGTAVLVTAPEDMMGEYQYTP